MPALDRFSKLIGKIYGVSTNCESWHGVLREIAVLTKARMTSLLYYSPEATGKVTKGDKVVAAFGLDPGFTTSYQSYYHRCNVYAQLMRPHLREGLVLTHEQYCRDEVILRSEYYNDFQRHLGLFRVIAGVIESRRGEHLILSVNRGRNDASFRPDEMQFAGMLIPHIRRALDIGRRLEGSRFEGTETAEPKTLALQFGLTKREATVAQLLARGSSPHQICEQLQIQITTVRSHLQQLYRKTGARRQAELVSRLMKT